MAKKKTTAAKKETSKPVAAKEKQVSGKGKKLREIIAKHEAMAYSPGKAGRIEALRNRLKELEEGNDPDG